MRWRLWMFALAALVLAPGALGHPGVSATAVVKIDPDGRVTVMLRHDALAFALDDTPMSIADAPMYELLDGTDEALTQTLAEARERFLNLFRLLANDRQVNIEIVEFPTTAAVRAWQREHPERRLPLKMDIVARATLPMGTRNVSVRFPEVLADVVVTVDRPGTEPITLPLRPGEIMPAFEVRLGTGSAAAASHSQAGTPVGTLSIFWRYVVLGFTHIMPKGVDHALFVLGLFLLSPRLKALVWQITAFTIAHSITLTLTTFHLVPMQSIVVEPAIAASIAFIGVENLVTTKVHAWRPVVAFVFGLVHGMGFASALSQVGLPTGQLVAGLVAFNVGVECGHMTTLAAAFLLLGWWRNKPWYRRRVAIPLSLVIAAVALFWMVQRLMGPG